MKLKPAVLPAVLFFNCLNAVKVFADEGSVHKRFFGVDPDKLIAPLGAVTLVCVTTVLILGLYIKKNRKKFLPWHQRLAFAALTVALIHGAMAMFFG